MIHVMAAYHVDDSSYANVGRGSTRHAQRIYWRNLAVMFATARRHFPPSTRLTVFSNAEPPAAESRALVELGVVVRDIGFRQPYPPDFFPRYVGALHLLDAIDHVAEELGRSDVAIFVDPDCVWIRRPDALLEAVAEEGLLAYTIGYSPGRRANGVSRDDMRRIFGEIAHAELDGVPEYFGGEFCAFTKDTISVAAKHIADATDANMQRHQRGLPTLNTDEHILSYVFWQMGVSDNSSTFVRRLKTSPVWKNVSSDVRANEFELVLWHLSSEKKRGLLRLYRRLVSRRRPFARLDDDALRELIARDVGLLPRRGRRAADPVRRLAARVRHRIGLRRGRQSWVPPGG